MNPALPVYLVYSVYGQGSCLPQRWHACHMRQFAGSPPFFCTSWFPSYVSDLVCKPLSICEAPLNKKHRRYMVYKSSLCSYIQFAIHSVQAHVTQHLPNSGKREKEFQSRAVLESTFLKLISMQRLTCSGDMVYNGTKERQLQKITTFHIQSHRSTPEVSSPKIFSPWDVPFHMVSNFTTLAGFK